MSFKDQGYEFPIEVLSADELKRIRMQFDQWLRHYGGTYPREKTQKTHLLFSWADQLVHHPKIIAAVQEILGPDILCWTTNLFMKPAYSRSYVSWHQDAPYWGLEPHEVVTAWIALSDSNESNGGLCVLPGSHLQDLSPHRDTFAEDNLLTRGQEIAVDVDLSKTVCMNLRPGEMSLHHIRLAHGSGPNTSNEPRIGLAIRYIPTSVRQKKSRDFAQLVSGKDDFHHFDLEPRIQRDLDPKGVAAHQRALIRQIKNNFQSLPNSSFAHRLKLWAMRTFLPIALRIKYLVK